MKADKFIDGDVGVWRYRQREGPPISYIVRKGNSTRGFGNAKEAIAHIKWSKSIPSGIALREWFAQFEEDDAKAVAKPLDEFHQQIELENGHRLEIQQKGFGPEAHEPEEDPVANTKMVT